MNRKLACALVLTIVISINGCESNGNQGSPSPEPELNPNPNEENEQIDWNAAANRSTDALINIFWNNSGNYWNETSESQVFTYWTGAHATDVLIDAYQRTANERYLRLVNDWFNGVLSEMDDTFINEYYDDMEWNALALLRAYQVTDDKKFKNRVLNLWTDIKNGWSDVAGGGIQWIKSNPNGKNAISNAPASILASRLYQMTDEEDYLDWAEKIYNWQKKTLIDPETGAVWDNVQVQNDGTEEIKKDWIFTYNQGVFLGAGLELYQITGEEQYLNDAIRAANYTLSSLTNTADNLLKDEGGGDGGLFKGIFVRYFTLLILEEDLQESTRNRYVDFLEHNAKTLWAEGANNRTLYGSYWKNKPGMLKEVDQSVETSGSILIEAAAKLANEGLINVE